MAQSNQNKGGWFLKVKPFLFGGMGGMMGTICVQPVDMIKVQIQLTGEKSGASTLKTKNPFAVGAYVIKERGFFGLYRGLSAGLVRQMTYTTARMGLFRTFSDKLSKNGEPISYLQKVLCSLTAGGLAAITGTPADVALIRMQADVTLPPEKRRNYKNVIDAFIRIVREDGVKKMFVGCSPTVTRAMALNVGMLASYDQAKQTVLPYFGPGYATNLSSSAIAGFFAAFFSLPFDFVKSRMQKMQRLPNGSYPYKSSIDCAGKTLVAEGPLAFYKGFPTYYVRIAPHAMIVLLSVETLNHFYKKYQGEL